MPPPPSFHCRRAKAFWCQEVEEEDGGGREEVGIRLSAQALPAEREMRKVSGDGVEGEEGGKNSMRIFGGKGVFSSGREREKYVRISKASERKDFFFLRPSSLPSETSKPLRYILPLSQFLRAGTSGGKPYHVRSLQCIKEDIAMFFRPHLRSCFHSSNIPSVACFACSFARTSSTRSFLLKNKALCKYIPFLENLIFFSPLLQRLRQCVKDPVDVGRQLLLPPCQRGGDRVHVGDGLVQHGHLRLGALQQGPELLLLLLHRLRHPAHLVVPVLDVGAGQADGGVAVGAVEAQALAEVARAQDGPVRRLLLLLLLLRRRDGGAGREALEPGGDGGLVVPVVGGGVGAVVGGDGAVPEVV